MLHFALLLLALLPDLQPQHGHELRRGLHVQASGILSLRNEHLAANFPADFAVKKPVPRRDYRAVLADIQKLLDAGSRDEAAYTKLANEIAGGVKDF